MENAREKARSHQTGGIQRIHDLIRACEEELEVRGPMPPLTDQEAADANKISQSVSSKPLEEVIELAFQYREADSDEVR